MQRRSYLLGLLLLLVLSTTAFSQVADSLPAKVTHAEPLFFDLVRDLGARRGEREWNVGMGIVRKNAVHHLSTLVEFEFAPVNRLGLEVEVPVSFLAVRGTDSTVDHSGNR